MKRLRAILCALLAGALLAGCGVQPRTDDKQGGGAAVDLTRYAVKEAAFPAYPREPRYEDYFNDNGEGDWDAYMAAEDEYMAAMQKLGKGRLDQESAAPVLDFADRTAGAIFADSENRVYSPISLYAALAMLTEVTSGDTKQQVMDLLAADGTETLRQQIKDLWIGVYTDDDQSVCRLANAAFLRENAEVKQEAVDTLADWHFASTYRVPMGTESGSYRKGDGYTAAPRSLNYGRMVFVLPDEGVTPESLLQRQGFLAELTGDYNAAELVWSVPKFDVKSSTELNEVLQALGVTDAFDWTKADFAPLTANGAFLSSAMQAARVKIDEEGVEAAAYTELVCADSAMMEVPPTVEMDLDRPFLFAIFDYNNIPLFVGTVNTLA